MSQKEAAVREGPSYRNRDFSEIPFFRPQHRSSIRENFESRVLYEDWVAGDIVTNTTQKRDRTWRSGVKKLEEDSDFPAGQPNFHRAFCVPCRKDYGAHVPPQWSCVICQTKVWQPDDDPDSCRCARCRTMLAPQVKYKMLGKVLKFSNPLGKKVAHHCLRCGKLFCSECCALQKQNCPEYGWEKPVRVCRMCVIDIAKQDKPPEGKPESDDEVDPMVNLDGYFLQEDEVMFLPYWAPKCPRCKQKPANIPPEWKCTSCRIPMWQPAEAPESQNCFVCDKKLDKAVQCHRCGHRVCNLCGAYAQPLVDLGWTMGTALPVCKLCYGASPTTPIPVGPKQALTSSDSCAVCFLEIALAARVACHRCGRICCLGCTPYRQPFKGQPQDQGQPVCEGCFMANGGCGVSHVDLETWIPHCHACGQDFPTTKPPPRWQCPRCNAMVWQPKEHVQSLTCWGCHGIVKKAINCRSCGRIVCEEPCGSARREVPERDFTAGILYSVCRHCMKKGEKPGRQEKKYTTKRELSC